MTTFGQMGRTNSIGFLRLVAASLVIVGHSFPYGGFGTDPLIELTDNQIAIGRFPVDIFFALSGYLIAMSFGRTPSWVVYAWHRVLRIYPAFLTCILITGLILAPLLGDGFGLYYIVRNASIVLGVIDEIPGMFTDTPGHGSVNSALWTLPWEVRAYILLGVIGVIGAFRRRWMVGLVFLLCWAGFVVQIFTHPGLATSPSVTSGLRLLTFFFAGTLFFVYRKRIPVRWELFVGSIVLMVGATIVGVIAPPYSAGVFYAFAPIPLTYAVMYLGMRLGVTKINSENDRSYGIYIYGTLLLNVLAYFGLDSIFSDDHGFWDWLAYVALAYAATYAAASLSWFLIEKPALSLKERRPWQRRPAASPDERSIDSELRVGDR
ncbi:hypothetical protein SEA_DOGGS_30 [Gordonia phage Doggs]|nr:hypothetical protein SEA_DOGGS_30 [Gordonia phage Doggs]